MERQNESIAALELSQQKDARVLYGEKDIRLVGLIERVENIEVVIEVINGMPSKVHNLDIKFDEFVETDKKRVWMMRGIMIGLGIQLGQSTGIWEVLMKVLE